MKILVVASEASPFVKTGGLGDVLGALPKELTKLGNEVKLFLPFYQAVNLSKYQCQNFDWSVEVIINEKPSLAKVCYAEEKKIPLAYYFIRNDYFFDRPELYKDNQTGKDYTDNDERFIFFSRAVLEAVKRLDWKPDIIHVHDWQAGLVSVYIKTIYENDPFFNDTKSVLTIHNLAYQGTFVKEKYVNIGLPENLFYAEAPFEFYGKVNFLKAAIVYADKITTVSEKYAEEIQTKQMGCGLNGVLKERSIDITGILNGVDYTIWSPSRDKKIPCRYHRANLSGKRTDKIELLGYASLPVREKTPLIGMISRLTDQKGFDLLVEAAADIFELNLQMIILGTGEEKYHQLLKKLENCFPDKLKVFLTFDDELAHKIEAASDIFLMPSRFEPCGLNQMYSLKYGTIPIIHKVGGLSDTVVDINLKTNEGTGFVFEEYTVKALLETINKAVTLYSKRRLWTKIMKIAMQQDFSWSKSAKKYAQLFKQLIYG